MPTGEPLVLPTPAGVLLDEPLQAPAGGLLPATLNGLVRLGRFETRPGLAPLGDAVNERVLGSIWLRDLTHTVQLVVGTTLRWKRLNPATQLYVDLSGGSLLTGSPTAPVTFTAIQIAAGPAIVGVNEADLPRQWLVGAASYTTLANAPRARTVATGLHRIVYGHTTESGVLWPHRLRWSALGDSASYPANAFADLDDTPDHIVAVRRLGRRAVAVYKDMSQWLALSSLGSDAQAFEIDTMDHQPGPLGPAAVCQGPGGTTQVYLGIDGNLYAFDGVRARIVARTAGLLQGRIVVATQSLTSAVYHPLLEEVWVSVPLDADSAPTHLLVYSVRTGGVTLHQVPASVALTTLGATASELETATDALPDVPTDQLPDVPTDQLGVSARGLYLLAGTASRVYTWEGPTDDGAAIAADWQVLLPVLPDQEYEFDGVEAHVVPPAVPVTLSVRTGATVDALTETGLGTITPNAGETTRRLDTPLRGRIVVVRLQAAAGQAVRLRRLQVYAWPRKLAT